jgi:hypothetical protein
VYSERLPLECGVCKRVGKWEAVIGVSNLALPFWTRQEDVELGAFTMNVFEPVRNSWELLDNSFSSIIPVYERYLENW